MDQEGHLRLQVFDIDSKRNSQTFGKGSREPTASISPHEGAQLVEGGDTLKYLKIKEKLKSQGIVQHDPSTMRHVGIESKDKITPASDLRRANFMEPDQLPTASFQKETRQIFEDIDEHMIQVDESEPSRRAPFTKQEVCIEGFNEEDFTDGDSLQINHGEQQVMTEMSDLKMTHNLATNGYLLNKGLEATSQSQPHFHQTKIQQSMYQSQDCGQFIRQVHSEGMQEVTEIYCWGDNSFGQLGLGFNFQEMESSKLLKLPKQCSYSIAIHKMSCGLEHSAFVTSAGLIYTMGSNSSGQLGIGDPMIQLKSSPILIECFVGQQVLDIACGDRHTLVLSTSSISENLSPKSDELNSSLEKGSQVYAWGCNQFGQIGCGLKNNQPIKYAPARVNFDSYFKPNIVKLACGGKHSAFIDDIGRLFMCGKNEYGECGCERPEEIIDAPLHVSKITDQVTQVACGVSHTLALTIKGQIFGMGSNSSGQIGIGKKTKLSVAPIQIADLGFTTIVEIRTGTFSAALSFDRNFYIWGRGVFGTFYSPHRIKSFNQLDIKDFSISRSGSSYVLTQKGTLYGWGDNSFGQLGIGDFEQRLKPTKIAQVTKRNISSVSLGNNFVIALGETTNQPKTEDDNDGPRYQLDIRKHEEHSSASVILRKNSSELISIDQLSVSHQGFNHEYSQQNVNTSKQQTSVQSSKNSKGKKVKKKKAEGSKLVTKQSQNRQKSLENLNEGMKLLARYALEKKGRKKEPIISEETQVYQSAPSYQQVKLKQSQEKLPPSNDPRPNADLNLDQSSIDNRTANISAAQSLVNSQISNNCHTSESKYKRQASKRTHSGNCSAEPIQRKPDSHPKPYQQLRLKDQISIAKKSLDEEIKEQSDHKHDQSLRPHKSEESHRALIEESKIRLPNQYEDIQSKKRLESVLNIQSNQIQDSELTTALNSGNRNTIKGIDESTTQLKAPSQQQSHCALRIKNQSTSNQLSQFPSAAGNKTNDTIPQLGEVKSFQPGHGSKETLSNRSKSKNITISQKSNRTPHSSKRQDCRSRATSHQPSLQKHRSSPKNQQQRADLEANDYSDQNINVNRNEECPNFMSNQSSIPYYHSTNPLTRSQFQSSLVKEEAQEVISRAEAVILDSRKLSSSSNFRSKHAQKYEMEQIMLQNQNKDVSQSPILERTSDQHRSFNLGSQENRSSQKHQRYPESRHEETQMLAQMAKDMNEQEYDSKYAQYCQERKKYTQFRESVSARDDDEQPQIIHQQPKARYKTPNERQMIVENQMRRGNEDFGNRSSGLGEQYQSRYEELIKKYGIRQRDASRETEKPGNSWNQREQRERQEEFSPSYLQSKIQSRSTELHNRQSFGQLNHYSDLRDSVDSKLKSADRKTEARASFFKSDNTRPKNDSSMLKQVMNDWKNESSVLSPAKQLQHLVHTLLEEKEQMLKDLERQRQAKTTVERCRDQLEEQLHRASDLKQQQMGKLETKISDLEYDLDRFKKHVFDLQDQVEQHRAVKESLRRKLKETEEQLYTSDKRNEKLGRELKEYKAEANMFREDVAYLTTETENLLDELKIEQDQRIAKEQLLKEIEADFRIKQEQANQRINNQNQEIQILKGKIKSQEIEIDRAQQTNHQHQNEKEDISLRLNQVDSELFDVRNQLTLETQKRKDFENQILVHKQQAQTFAADNENLRSNINSLLNQQSKMQISIHEHMQEEKKLKVQIQMDNEKMEALGAQIKNHLVNLQEVNELNQRLQQRLDQEIMSRAQIYRDTTTNILANDSTQKRSRSVANAMESKSASMAENPIPYSAVDTQIRAAYDFKNFQTQMVNYGRDNGGGSALSYQTDSMQSRSKVQKTLNASTFALNSTEMSKIEVTKPIDNIYSSYGVQRRNSSPLKISPQRRASNPIPPDVHSQNLQNQIMNSQIIYPSCQPYHQVRLPVNQMSANPALSGMNFRNQGSSHLSNDQHLMGEGLLSTTQKDSQVQGGSYPQMTSPKRMNQAMYIESNMNHSRQPSQAQGDSYANKSTEIAVPDTQNDYVPLPNQHNTLFSSVTNNQTDRASKMKESEQRISHLLNMGDIQKRNDLYRKFCSQDAEGGDQEATDSLKDIKQGNQTLQTRNLNVQSFGAVGQSSSGLDVTLNKRNSNKVLQSFDSNPLKHLQKINECTLETYNEQEPSRGRWKNSNDAPTSSKKRSITASPAQTRKEEDIGSTTQPLRQNSMPSESRIQYPQYPTLSQRREKASRKTVYESENQNQNTVPQQSSRSSSKAIDFNTLIRQRYMKEKEARSKENSEEETAAPQRGLAGMAISRRDQTTSSREELTSKVESSQATKIVKDSLADLKARLGMMRKEREIQNKQKAELRRFEGGARFSNGLNFQY